MSLGGHMSTEVCLSIWVLCNYIYICISVCVLYYQYKCNAAILVPASDGNTDELDHLSPLICSESLSSLIFVLCVI